MPKSRLLIPDYFNFSKYYPDDEPLPYEATAAKLRDEILARTDDIEVVAAESPDETGRAIVDADYMVTYWIRKELLERARKLRWIQVASAGMDHFYKLTDVSVEDFQARGIMLSNAGGVTRIVIGEQVLAYMLMFSRGMHRAMRQQYERRWQIFCADELHSRTVGIIGLGGIGNRVAELCKSLGMHVIGTKRCPKEYEGPADEVVATADYIDVLERADYLVLACAISDQTRGMINASTLRRMRPNAYLINVGRGELVVEPDLVRALEEGWIAGAGLDTFGPPGGGRTLRNLEELSPDSPLWDLPNVIITPNHASGSPRVFEYLADIVVENIDRITKGLEPRGRYA